VLDPKVMWPDGGVALVEFAPSPDDRYLAYAESKAGADWVTYVAALGNQSRVHGGLGKPGTRRRLWRMAHLLTSPEHRRHLAL
jgi:hypothetical protein